MATNSNGAISRLGRVAIGLALLGGVVALYNVWSDYQKTGAVDWSHVALAVGVPAFMYAIMRSASTREARTRPDSESGGT